MYVPESTTTKSAATLLWPALSSEHLELADREPDSPIRRSQDTLCLPARNRYVQVRSHLSPTPDTLAKSKEDGRKTVFALKSGIRYPALRRDSGVKFVVQISRPPTMSLEVTNQAIRCLVLRTCSSIKHSGSRIHLDFDRTNFFIHDACRFTVAHSSHNPEVTFTYALSEI